MILLQFGTTWEVQVTNHNPYIATFDKNLNAISAGYASSITIPDNPPAYISFRSGDGMSVWINEVYQIK